MGLRKTRNGRKERFGWERDLERSKAPEGRRTPGRWRVWRSAGLLGGGLHLIRERELMMFAFLLTNTYGVTGTRTTIAHLPEIKLKPLIVPVPSPDEQADIVEALGTVDQKLGSHQGKLAALQDLFRTLLHELMTAKTRVHELELSA